MGMFAQSLLWKRSLAPQSNDEYEQQRTVLRAAFLAMRENVSNLTRQIPIDMKGLTLHDTAHLDALWNTADVIIGDDYPANPAEAFVLGCAFLLHDTGLTIAGTPGGLDAIKASPEWRDAAVEALTLANIRPISQTLIERPPAELFDRILFAAIRIIHGRSAERFAFVEFKGEGGEIKHIMDHAQLRNHYSEIIGQIAASHTWPIEDVASRFSRRIGTISPIPTAWPIDPLKIACILRCADAAQIDNRRAPDFLMAILNLRGISHQHWAAQNKLSAPLPDKADPEAILYSPPGSYSVTEVDAWWCAHDLIKVVDNELVAVNDLLRSTGRPAFAAKRVLGASSPRDLAQYVRTNGWEPIRAQVHVSNPKAVAETLGGTILYGDAPFVAVRELIQNATDAVRARRRLETPGSGYRGKVNVRLRQEEPQDGPLWLDVRDDGIGMSERVLTGPLLDFGNSFWVGELVKSEFPGLMGSGVRPTGRFGIGFYSIFMISEEVVISSRRFDAAMTSGKTLWFKDGLQGRPMIMPGLAPGHDSAMQTEVRCRLKHEFAERLRRGSVGFPEEKFSLRRAPETAQAALQDAITRICLTVDCDVLFQWDTQEPVVCHSERWFEEDGEAWLTKLFIVDGEPTEKQRRIIGDAAKRLSLIKDGDRVVGRAAISVEQNDAELAERIWLHGLMGTDLSRFYVGGHFSIGGFTASSGNFFSVCKLFFGVIDGNSIEVTRYKTPDLGGQYLDAAFHYPTQREQWLDAQERAPLTVQETAGGGEGIKTRALVAFGRYPVRAEMFSYVDIDREYREFSDVAHTSLHGLREITQEEGISFLTFRNPKSRKEYVVDLSYHDRDEFRTLKTVMRRMALTRVCFISVRSRELTSVPTNGDRENRMNFLKLIEEGASALGFRVMLSRTPVPPEVASQSVKVGKRQRMHLRLFEELLTFRWLPKE